MFIPSSSVPSSIFRSRKCGAATLWQAAAFFIDPESCRPRLPFRVRLAARFSPGGAIALIPAFRSTRVFWLPAKTNGVKISEAAWLARSARISKSTASFVICTVRIPASPQICARLRSAFAGNAGRLRLSIRGLAVQTPGPFILDKRLASGRCLIPLLGDEIQVFPNAFNWLRIELESTLATFSDAAHDPDPLQYSKVLGDRLPA